MRQLSEEEMNVLKQMPGNVSGVENMDEQPATVAEQIPETQPVQDDKAKLEAMLGQKVGYKQAEEARSSEMQETAKKHNIQIGANIFENADLRDGWQVVDRRLFGERDMYYPKDWEFRIRPATVEAIRNWSTIDDENANVVDDVFNEIIKSNVNETRLLLHAEGF